MSHNWSYVIAGYALVTITIGSYAAWVKMRLRKLRRDDERA